MIYALTISIVFSTMALVTLALSELARSLLHRVALRRHRTLGLAMRLRSELSTELDRLTAANRDLQVRMSRGSGRTELGSERRLFEGDALGDMHAHAILTLRNRLGRIDEQLKMPDDQDLRRLCQTLSELTSEVSTLAVEIEERVATERGHAWLSSLDRRGTPKNRAA